ncbi:MAG: NAD(P)/FAD-dependent oxidoreductase [Microcoleaceae cyanobacterium MO_207.B10]|nr:NAD(P)/FAD-dependent oxidoreductase [Microcoleaceae cyanobacterium MO_207.B10]
MTTKKQIVIIGAGPAGLLLAHYLLTRSNDYQVTVYDKRSDPRTSEQSKRAFVIGISQRGRQALQKIDGLWNAVREKGVAVSKTAVYSPKKSQWQYFQRSKDPDYFNLLISRDYLCITLLDELEKRAKGNLNLIFNATCNQVDLKQHQVKLIVGGESVVEQSYDLLVGADGVHSVVRNAMLKQPKFDFQQRYFDTIWKVMHVPRPVEMPANASHFFRKIYPNNGLKTAPCKLSVGAIPEINDKLCILMFWNPAPQIAEENPPGINTTADVQKIVTDTWFPNLGIKISDAQAQEYFQQRPSTIFETKCSRYHDLPGQAIIVGDAAHAMSSRLGQGCQAAFSDVMAFDRLLQEEADNLNIVLPKYSEQQVNEGHAITDLNTQLLPRSQRLLFLMNMVMGIQSKLSKTFPKLSKGSYSYLLSQTTLPYSQIAERFQLWMRLIKWSNDKIISQTSRKV